jgi:hypothetical protein
MPILPWRISLNPWKKSYPGSNMDRVLAVIAAVVIIVSIPPFTVGMWLRSMPVITINPALMSFSGKRC